MLRRAPGAIADCPVLESHSDACALRSGGRLPADTGVGLIGNQGGLGRDPLTFLIARDGLHYDKHWAVEIDAPLPKWGGPRGYQYPSFVWCTTGCPGPVGAKGGLQHSIIFTYSVSKEDILITIAPLASLWS